MSYDDFCRCDSDELEAVFKAYSESFDECQHQEWERTRTAAAISIQPHVRKRITPRSLLPLPWDNKKTVNEELVVDNMSSDDRKKRFEELNNRLKP